MSILKSTNIGRCSFEVDLGLSVNWCAYNIGATKPEEIGLYFAWGDTKGYEKSEIKGNMFTDVWYKKLHASKIKADLKLDEDAAHKYFGGKWRMPTREEFKELKQNTEKIAEILNGIKGMRFISLQNNNSIFIPFEGFAVDGYIDDFGNGFSCWSSVIGEEESAYTLCDSYIGADEFNDDRCLGFSIRAVCDK